MSHQLGGEREEGTGGADPCRLESPRISFSHGRGVRLVAAKRNVELSLPNDKEKSGCALLALNRTGGGYTRPVGKA